VGLVGDQNLAWHAEGRNRLSSLAHPEIMLPRMDCG
jgi:hypothetical protein